MQSFLFYTLLLASAIGWFAFAFLVLWYWQREKREHTRIRQTKADIADIMLLFQTMRDVVAQQKQLAQEFNEELERKVGAVKQVLGAAVEKNERLYERQRLLERELEDTRAELQSVQRQMAFLHESGITSTVSNPAPRAARPEPSGPPAPPFVALPGDEQAETPLDGHQDEELPGGDGGAGPVLWEQIDMAALSDNTVLSAELEDDELEEENEGLPPEEAQAARDAFRALLDISTRGQAPEAPREEIRAGEKVNPALQQRILQYAEAGMAPSDIARELGIGRGEVRLVLSLAKPKQ